MAGLPKKYAKMGFKKGWREYKRTRSARKRNPSNPSRPSVKRKSGVKRKRVTTPMVIYKFKRSPFLNKAQKSALLGLAGVGGAAGSALVANFIPVDPRWKATAQTLIGIFAGVLASKRQPFILAAAMGSTVVGMYSWIKQSGINLPSILAGDDDYLSPKKIEYYGCEGETNTTNNNNMGVNQSFMGRNYDFNDGKMLGYGQQVLQPYS